MENFFAGMFSPEWLAALSGILLLDLLLSGDNAIMIALACKNLPQNLRRKAIIVGGLGAVFVRIVCTLFATGLLASPYIEFVGGAALVFIAIKLVTDHNDGRIEENGKKPTSFGEAVRTILIADFIMSIDNILSLAGLANTVPEGKWSLIICGLMISIPIVLFGAQIFLMIMLKVPALIYLGAGILGWTAGELMTEDPALGSYLAPYAFEIKVIFVLLVLGLGYFINRRREAAK
ncbi:YjbE family putative metal transport protein [Mitsuokella sp.]|uniref:YjbE family putative metal transport protein n=1 Tax=unclassified Mitsuokella TaxID=2637239 RepID=UPI003D7C8FB4